MSTCDICDGENAVAMCVDCKQSYCLTCSEAHTKESATKTHLLLKLLPSEQDSRSENANGRVCKICAEKAAEYLCVICKDLYCDDCHRRHERITATKDHTMVQLYLWDSVKNPAQVVHDLKPLDRKLNRGTFFLEKTCASPGDVTITRIRGLAILADSRLLLIDSKNCCMKIFDSEWYNFATRKDLKDEPREIATVSQDEVAISFDNKREVRLYKLDKFNNLRNDKSFKTEEKPFSLSYSKKTFVIEMGEGDDGMIVVTDFNGVIKYILRSHGEPLGLFTGNSIRLVNDNEKKTVYVVNVDGFVHCVNYEGKILWTAKMNMPRGITLHGHMLYVASKADHKFYRIDSINGKVYDFLSDKDKISQLRFLTL